MKKIELCASAYLSSEAFSAEEALILECLPLLGGKIRKIYGVRESYPDDFQSGVVVVIKAVRRYKKEKMSLPFLAYMNNVTRFYALSLWRKKEGSEKVIRALPYGENPLGRSAEEVFLKEEERKQLLKAMESLSPFLYNLIWAYYFEGVSLKVLAKEWHLSYSNIKKKKQKALEALRLKLMA